MLSRTPATLCAARLSITTTSPQPWAQHLVQVGEEYLAVGRRLDGHGPNPSATANRPQHAQRSPTPRRHALPHPSASPRTFRSVDVRPRKSIFPGRVLLVGLPLRTSPADGSVLLSGVERLFFKRSPNSRNRLDNRPYSLSAATRRSRTVVRASSSGCSAIHSPTCRRISALNLLRGPRGPDGGRAQLPVRRNVADTFLAQPTLTGNAGPTLPDFLLPADAPR